MLTVNLSCRRSSNLGLVVLQKPDKDREQLLTNVLWEVRNNLQEEERWDREIKLKIEGRGRLCKMRQGVQEILHR
jgi:hypothetical protein